MKMVLSQFKLKELIVVARSQRQSDFDKETIGIEDEIALPECIEEVEGRLNWNCGRKCIEFYNRADGAGRFSNDRDITDPNV